MKSLSAILLATTLFSGSVTMAALSLPPEIIKPDNASLSLPPDEQSPPIQSGEPVVMVLPDGTMIDTTDL